MSTSDHKTVIRRKLKPLACSIRIKSPKVGQSWAPFKKSIWTSVTTPKIQNFFWKFFWICLESFVLILRDYVWSFYVIVAHFWPIWGEINDWKLKKSIWRSVTTPKIRIFYQKFFWIFSESFVMVHGGHLSSFYVILGHFWSIRSQMNESKSKKKDF